jgi:hypothetical protein
MMDNHQESSGCQNAAELNENNCSTASANSLLFPLPLTTEFDPAKIEWQENGVVIFRGFFSTDQQQNLYRMAYQQSIEGNFYLTRPSVSKNVRNFALLRHFPSPLAYWNWPGVSTPASLLEKQPPLLAFSGQLYPHLRQLAFAHPKASIAMQDLDEALILPTEWNSNSMNAILYSERGCMAPHVDGPLGWVLSISLGCSSIFTFNKMPIKITNNNNTAKNTENLNCINDTENNNNNNKVNSCNSNKGYGSYGYGYGCGGSGPDDQERIEKDDSLKEVLLESGDVVLFEGGRVMHGITRIIPNTEPCWWPVNENKDENENEHGQDQGGEKQKINTLGFKRLNIQFRADTQRN